MSSRPSLRVGLVCPYSLATPGGVQNHVRSLVPALARAGVDAEILAPTDAKPSADREWGVPVVSLGRSVPVPANGSVARIGLDPRGLVRLRERSRRYDVLHVHEPLVPGVALAAALQRRVATVGTFHAASEGGYWPYRVFGQITSFPLGLAWERLDVRTAVSEAAAERVRPYFSGRLDIVPNGFEYARFAQAAPVSERETAAGPVVLFLGRDEPRKGLDVALVAFAELRHVHPEAELWIAGPGTEGVRAPGARAFGAVDDTTLASLYASADVFCAPARFGESFGIVLLEAMAAGAPVVASSIDGYAAVARDNNEALLVPPGDAQALAGALRRVIEDDELADRLVRNGRVRAQEFDWSELGGRVVELYERAAASR